MRILVCLMLACAVTLSFVSNASAKDPFEKTAWKIKVSPEEGAKAKEFDDTLTFKGSKVESTALKEKGFEAAAYEEDVRRGPLATFNATMKSEKEGEAVWSGTVTGSEIKGELKWTKKDGTVVNYTYTGSKSD
jgi:hypothetical protein